MVGLRHVGGSVASLPTGVWGDRVGMMVAADFVAMGKGFAGVIVGVGLTTEEQFDQTLEGVRTDLASRDVRCYTPFFVIIGGRFVTYMRIETRRRSGGQGERCKAFQQPTVVRANKSHQEGGPR
jgi:hypothetical protein